MRATQKPQILIGAIFLALASLASIDNLISLPNTFDWLTNVDNTFVPATVIDIFSMIVITVSSAGLAIWAFVAKTPKVLGVPAIILIVAGPVCAIGVNLFWLTQGSPFLEAFFQTYGGPGRIAASTSVFISLIGASLVAAGAFSAKPEVASPTVTIPAAVGAFDPRTGQPIAPTGGTQSNLPLIALILAFVVPLGAVIVGHISLSQMKQGLISSQNIGMAKTGLILGYVFIGLGFVFGIIFVVLYAALSPGF